MLNELENMCFKSTRLYFLGSKITADGDCSHEIKRHLLLGRTIMTNLDSIFKSTDITLPTKVVYKKFGYQGHISFKGWDRNHKGLIEAKEIKRRWQEYTQELYK